MTHIVTHVTSSVKIQRREGGTKEYSGDDRVGNIEIIIRVFVGRLDTDTGLRESGGVRGY